MGKFIFIAAALNLSLGLCFGAEPDWSAQATIDPALYPNGRANIYQWDEKSFVDKVKRGEQHALHYPVLPTGLLVPARPSLHVLNAKPGDALFIFMKSLFSFSKDFKDFQGFWEWLGLTPPAKDSGEEYPMGVSIITRNGADGFTLSCTACHSSNLFGKSIIGMTNRFSRANLFFVHGQNILQKLSPGIFALSTGATPEEKEMYAESRDHIQSVGLKKPATLGLDSSLSQVALSLAKRAPGPGAERTEYDVEHPRPTILDNLVADSKPAVWWNTKHKTHWLSDGSVVSGNPVFTNFLWNEIGRGADLPALTDWLTANNEVVQELTTAVFANEAPRWKDFFGEQTINIARAKHGQILYSQTCVRCHGDYQKAWDLSPSQWEDLHQAAAHDGLPMPSIIDTLQVNYTEKVKDVGTDPGRRLGMQALADGLNPLDFSKKYGIVIEVQAGYVAPPLDGIWARYPYLHNNSIPNLCALMTPPSQRPSVYYSGKAIDKDHDYDQDCVGYPLGDLTPSEWKTDLEHRYDTQITGLSNSGHYDGIFTVNGIERFSAEDKKDLIEFLKTL